MLNELVTTKNKKNRTRVGRGPGSKGKTAGRGHKGQKSRSGGGVPILFEGGQSNFVLRTPKRGFKNYNRKEFDVINVSTLEKIDNISKIDIEALVKLKLIDGNKPLKILGNGEITKKLDIVVNHISKSAMEKIKSAGGSVKII
ncbi:MAG: 50S ribosomal protein L15 [Thermodesulfobacteriota bacterium]|nr:MAG: 50S ribosomal protein L15 [Candidatus Dadabacteria bacterium]